MKFLGLDYGEKRIGLAVADEENKIAFPREVIVLPRALYEIKEIVRQEKISKIIIGLPLSFSGTENEQVKKVRAFAEELERTVRVPVEFVNEVLTSKIAAAKSSKDTIDSSAAALILQSYLDKTNNF